MSLKSDLEKRLEAENAAEREKQRQQLTESAYQKMYETVYGHTLSYAYNQIPSVFSPVMKSIHLGYDFTQKRNIRIPITFQNLYLSTQPTELSSEIQELVKEFTDLCPSSAWKCVPAQPDAKKASCKWYDNLFLNRVDGQYMDESYFTKIKLPDGSIHIDGCALDLHMIFDKTDYPRWFTLFSVPTEKGAKEVFQEASRRIEQSQRFQDGTQEYVAFRYHLCTDGDDWFFSWLVIFRDGTVFDLGGGHGESPLGKPKEKFYQFLLNQLTAFSTAKK